MKKSLLAQRGPLFIGAVSGVLLATSTIALADLSYTEVRKLQETGQVLPEVRILEIVKQTRPGEVTGLELERKHGRLVYEVEVRDAQWQEWDLVLDAVSGEVLKEKRDD